MLKYLILIIPATVYAEKYDSYNTAAKTSYSIKNEAIEWGIYSSLYAGAFLMDKHGPFFDDPLIGGATGAPYKDRDTVPMLYIESWMAGIFGYIALSPNEEGFLNRVTYNNIKGFYESIAYAHFITVFTKVTAGRKRPSYDNYPEDDRNNGGRKSFISTHSSIAYVTATYSSLYITGHSGNNSDLLNLGLKATVISASFSAAAYTAWSRIEDNRHHKSDVIAGGAVGILSGIAGYIHQNSRFRADTSSAMISIIPLISKDAVYISILNQY